MDQNNVRVRKFNNKTQGQKEEIEVGNSKIKLIVGGIIAFIALVLISSTYYTIDEGERGILLTNGKVSGVEGPGLHFCIPMIQNVIPISTRTVTRQMGRMPMYSYDQQTAELGLSITFHSPAEKVQELYTRFGEDGIFVNGIAPRVNEVSKSVFGQFTAARAIQERGELNNQMNIRIKESLKDLPIVVENVQIENVDFSDTYEKAVEQAAKAKADVERAKSELARFEQESQQKVKTAEAEGAAKRAMAEAEATAIKTKADAEAYQIRVRGEAEAEAIRARSEAINSNPQLIEYMKAESWNGVLPTTMVPGGTVPFINIR